MQHLSSWPVFDVHVHVLLINSAIKYTRSLQLIERVTLQQPRTLLQLFSSPS